MQILRDTLDALKAKNRYRTLSGAAGLDFSSNDYLGLKDHPAIKAAAIAAIEDGVGLGAGGSRLLRGNAPEHMALEEFAADHYGFERALYFANGFGANYALLRALAGRHDVVLYDALVHASMRDALFSPVIRAEKVPHNDVNAFEDALKKHRANAKTRQILMAVESLYSMDGDFAPLAALYDLALRYDAVLIVDEAHSTGVFGDGGRGLMDGVLAPRSAPARLSVKKTGTPENLIVLHTCGKALGLAGGLVCASADVADYLINTARPFIYSTAPPPLQAFLTMKAIGICAGATGEAARVRLRQYCALAQARLGGAGSQIVPVILGADQAAVAAAAALQERGYDIRAIRPPTVPEGSARLRLSLNAKLAPDQVRAALDALDDMRR